MLLAMDTATTTASLAVYNLDTGVLLAEWTWQARRRQTQDLMAAAQQMLAQADVTPRQLTALAVTTGPGSFTGVRIAISAAKGIALGLPTSPRAVGLPTLCVTAGPWLAPARAAGATLCACIQAGRGRYNWVFWPQHVPEPTMWRPTADDHGVGTAQELAAALGALSSAPIWLVGETQADLRSAVAEMSHVCLVDEISSMRRAGQLARLAAQQLTSGEDATIAVLQPLYLRSP
jgi:tRNA threonylcarbamoyl adenosine modification protein YeaZ